MLINLKLYKSDVKFDIKMSINEDKDFPDFIYEDEKIVNIDLMKNRNHHHKFIHDLHSAKANKSKYKSTKKLNIFHKSPSIPPKNSDFFKFLQDRNNIKKSKPSIYELKIAKSKRKNVVTNQNLSNHDDSQELKNSCQKFNESRVYISKSNSPQNDQKKYSINEAEHKKESNNNSEDKLDDINPNIDNHPYQKIIKCKKCMKESRNNLLHAVRITLDY